MVLDVDEAGQEVLAGGVDDLVSRPGRYRCFDAGEASVFDEEVGRGEVSGKDKPGVAE